MDLQSEVAVPLWKNRPPFSLGEKKEDTPVIIPVFPPRWKANGKAVVIFPGGGYTHFGAEEGIPYARYFASYGYTCFVVLYRLTVNGYLWQAILADAAHAVRTVRANAEALKINPDKIGVAGSSAGGHLCAMLSKLHREAVPGVEDDPAVSALPSWQILCYSCLSFGESYSNDFTLKALAGEESPEAALVRKLDPSKDLTPEIPPAFLWHTAEDRCVPCLNSTEYAKILQQLNIPFELHVYERGGHGKGLFGNHPWAEEAVRWMQTF